MRPVDTLPPIIADMITELRNKANPIHVRYNYLRTLETIVDDCNHAIWEFKQRK